MYTHGKHLDEVDLAVLRSWKESCTEESRTLDFKRDAYLLDSTKEAPKREFAADVCGFANAGGGIILLGIDEVRDEDTGQHGARFGEIVGVMLPPDGFAGYQQRAEAIVRDAIEPRGVAIRLREIATDDSSRPVIALGIDRSTRAPHRVRSYGTSDFYLRSLRVVERMDVDQVREAFRRTFTVLEGAERRLEEAERRSAGIPEDAPFFWAGLTPIFPTPFQFPSRDTRVRERLREIGRQRESLSSWDIGYDAHGAFLFSGGREGRPFPLFRIHRDGTVERGERLNRGSIDRDRRPVGGAIVGIRAWFIRSYSLAQAIENTYLEFQEVRETLGISGPAMLSAAVCKARDYELDPLVVYGCRSLERANPPAVDETVVVRPTIETSDDVLRRSLKEVADYFWNVWGYQECNGFDREGFPTDVLISWKGR